MASWDARPAGGLVGHADGTDSGVAHLFVSNSVNVASVSSECHAGGLVGRLNKSTEDMTLVNCGNLGNVHSATGRVGGVIGVFAGMAQNNDKNFDKILTLQLNGSIKKRIIPGQWQR